MIIGFNMAKNDKNVIVGLDIGTSSVKALVGVMNEDLEIDVLGIGKSIIF